MADLRARTLVSLWEALPSSAYNEGELNFYSEYDGGAIRSMFDAAVTLTGLQPLVSDVEQRFAAGAAAYVDDAEPHTAKLIRRAAETMMPNFLSSKRRSSNTMRRQWHLMMRFAGLPIFGILHSSGFIKNRYQGAAL